MAFVTVDRDSFADDDLVLFFHSYIYVSGFNWFTIDFGDGTGYVFQALVIHSIMPG